MYTFLKKRFGLHYTEDRQYGLDKEFDVMYHGFYMGHVTMKANGDLIVDDFEDSLILTYKKDYCGYKLIRKQKTGHKMIHVPGDENHYGYSYPVLTLTDVPLD